MPLFQFLTKNYPVVFALVACITIIMVYRNAWPRSFKTLAFFIPLYTTGDIAGRSMGEFYKPGNYFGYNILYDGEFIIICIFYYYQLKSRFVKKVIIFFLFVFLLYIMVHTVWFRDIYILQKSGYIMGGSFVILLSAAYLRQLYTSEETDNIFRDPMFWFSQAWFLNFAVMVPVAALENYLRKNFPDFGLNYSLMVTDISDCLRSLLLMTGFLCIGVPRK